MGGFLFLMDDIESIRMSIYDGVYSTRIKAPKGSWWRAEHEATFADYITMHSGDDVFFFNRRKVYGIGKLISIKYDCKFKNYPSASTPSTYGYDEISDKLLWDIGQESVDNRWICAFEPAPFFFENGIDMDDLLLSAPSHFRMLRAIERRSFIKLDDEESQAIKDLLIFRNRKELDGAKGTFQFNTSAHEFIEKNLLEEHILNAGEIMSRCVENDTLKHEMALECGVLENLMQHKNIDILGHWDYVSHQVVASPFKPIIYIDMIDIFAYSYIPSYDVIADFLVVELKKDTADIDAIHQTLKYVDWVKSEYAMGDYSRIKAIVIAKDYSNLALASYKHIGIRNYTYGTKPTRSEVWKELKLLKYRFLKDGLHLYEM